MKTGRKLKRRSIITSLTVLALIFIVAAISFEISVSNSKKISADDNTDSNPVESNVEKPAPEPTKPQIVCLDPGHGGKDTGAIYKRVTEASLNLTVSRYVRDRLQTDGYKVYMTRYNDTFVFKRPRATYCNSVKATILVAIHHNSYKSDTSIDYSTALYYKDSDQALAGNILDAVSTKLKTKNQGIAKFDDSELYIATMPAALSEGFFITNKKEYEQIIQKNSPRLSAEAEGIATGIENYFANPTKPSDTTTADSFILDRADYGD